ncbi:pyruvate formate-lyase-activating protein [Endozoicomonadaceae bacterium StTr2]
MLGRIHSEDSFSAVDGPGIRYVVFMQGCQMRCRYCHNRDSWSIKDQPSTEMDDILQRVQGVRHFLKNGGVTVSGGEPMLQAEFVAEFLRRCKQQGLHTCIDTGGFVKRMTSAVRDAVDAADLVLLDIKQIDPDMHRKLTLVPNEPVLNFARYLNEINKPVWIRHVVVDGYTTDPEYTARMADFLAPMKNIEKVELLPYHKLGKHKWDVLKDDYELEEVEPPSKELLETLANILRERGLKVTY